MYMYMYQDKTAASLPTVLTLPSGKCPHSRTQWPHWVSDSCNILRYVGGYNRHNQRTLGKWTLSPHYEWCQIQSTCTTGAHPVHVMFIYTVKLWCTCTCTPWHCSVALCVDKCTGHDSFLLNSVARIPCSFKWNQQSGNWWWHMKEKRSWWKWEHTDDCPFCMVRTDKNLCEMD